MTSSSVEFSTLEAAQAHGREWLFQHAAPLWSSAGVCPDGFFAERLTLQGERVEMPRRLRVQARQIFSFIEIGRLGWDGPWRALANQGVDLLLGRGRSPDGHFAHLFDANGEVVDRRLDLYDHAFGLFALGHAAQALGRTDALAAANDVMDLMDGRWRRPEGGFWEGEITPCPPYRQNPHMHMFEASLALSRAGGGDRWVELGNQLATLFTGRLQDSATGAITEYFDSDWRPLPGAEGAIVEPGHCLEWAWLFETGRGGGSGVETAEALRGFALKHGICSARGVAMNEVSLTGDIVDANARLWPQTERLKAAVARYRRTLAPEDRTEVLSAYAGLTRYFDTPCRGVWFDRWRADGSWIEEDAPASSFYHILGGLSELMACPA